MNLKKLFFLIAVFVSGLSVPQGKVYGQVCNCAHTVEPNVVFLDGARLKLKAGDTVCIKKSKKGLLKIKGFKGNAARPIVFINIDGQVEVSSPDRSYGISIEESEFIRFTGTGVRGLEYGFKISVENPNAAALSIGVGSSYFEVDHVEVARAGFAGIVAKTDPDCDQKTIRGKFVQRNTFIHDNYIHHTTGEGIYVGSSFYNGLQLPCNGRLLTLFPHDIVGVRIYNNRIEHVGWDGIQVGCAVADCEVYDNQITNYGTAHYETQMSGIQLNSGTTGKCYNNLIRNGSGHGIVVFGVGNNLVYNNVIVNAGRNYHPGDLDKQVFGILCDDRGTLAGRSFHFVNNTIISPKNEGIRILSILSVNNRVTNNLIINPGAFKAYEEDRAARTGKDAYINVTRPGVKALVYNNHGDMNLGRIQFVNTAAGDYRLRLTSPLFDAGSDPQVFGITTDFANRSRACSTCGKTTKDIGACLHWHGSSTNSDDSKDNRGDSISSARIEGDPTAGETESLAPLEDELSSEDVVLYPNPAQHTFSIRLQHPSGNLLHFEIRDVLGRTVLKAQATNSAVGGFSSEIDISQLSAGSYFLILPMGEKALVKKFEKH